MIEIIPGQKDLLDPARDMTIDRETLAETARILADASTAPATRTAYEGDWRRFLTWTISQGKTALPAEPEVVAEYLAHLHLGGKRPATIDRAIVAISRAHQIGGWPSPTLDPGVRAVARGIRRRHADTRQEPGHARAIQLYHVAACIRELPHQWTEARRTQAAAILALGYSGALRRGELANLNVGDIETTDEGMILHVRKSKTDEEGRGYDLAIPRGTRFFCPVRTVRKWLDLLGPQPADAPLFRPTLGGVKAVRLTGRTIDRTVKKCMTAAEFKGDWSSHGLRAGFCTDAARAGVAEVEIMRHSRHVSPRVFRRYVRPAEMWANPVLSRILAAHSPDDPFTATRETF